MLRLLIRLRVERNADRRMNMATRQSVSMIACHRLFFSCPEITGNLSWLIPFLEGLDIESL
jgi:hypothetical protein